MKPNFFSLKNSSFASRVVSVIFTVPVEIGFDQSVGALERGSELYGFEWIIFFLCIIPSRIA